MTSVDVPVTMDNMTAGAFNWSPELRDRQREKPIWRVITPAGDEAWLVIGAPEIRSLLVDQRIGRTHPDPEHAPQYVRSPVFEILRGLTRDGGPNAWHQWLRQMLVPHFTRRRMELLQPRIVASVHRRIDRLLTLGPPVELQGEFSRPLALESLFDLIGVPHEGRARCAELLRAFGGVDADSAAETRDALLDHLGDIAARTRADPADDVLSAMLTAGVSDSEAARILVLLLFAGHDSVAVHIGYGVARLAADPELAEGLRRDPSRMPTAVEEVLRTAVHGGSAHPHYANEDVDVAGVRIRAGELVLMDFALANYDERVFDCPEQVDLDRSPNPHLAFAHGSWHCLGAPLARMELNEVFTALLARMPRLHLPRSLADIMAQAEDEERLSSSLPPLPIAW